MRRPVRVSGSCACTGSLRQLPDGGSPRTENMVPPELRSPGSTDRPHPSTRRIIPENVVPMHFHRGSEDVENTSAVQVFRERRLDSPEFTDPISRAVPVYCLYVLNAMVFQRLRNTVFS